MGGGQPRDISAYTVWREEALPEVVRAFEFYAFYLQGQMEGMTDALSLMAIRCALEIDDVPRMEWPEMTHRSILVHQEVRRIQRPKEKK